MIVVVDYLEIRKLKVGRGGFNIFDTEGAGYTRWSGVLCSTLLDSTLLGLELELELDSTHIDKLWRSGLEVVKRGFLCVY